MKPLSDSMPLVTMVIPSYNHSLYVKETILSVVNQTYQNIELIIIDDGSNDDSSEIIQTLHSLCLARFVRFEFLRQQNRGLASVINQAIQWGRGKYFATLASDDMILPEKTEKTVSLLENMEDVIVACGAATVIDEEGEVIGGIKTEQRSYDWKDAILHEYVLCAPTQLIRFDALRSIGGIPGHIKIEDWYLWIKLTEDGKKIFTTNEILALYRRHRENYSSKRDGLLQARLDVLEYAKSSRYYSASCARVYLMAAIDFGETNKVKALSHIVAAVKHKNNVIMSRSLVYALLKVFIPAALGDLLRSYRGRP